MPRQARHDVLFEPIQVGPKQMRNRFWQVPHCNGAGVARPATQAEFRATKAEGGWAAVFTEACSFTPDADIEPWVVSKLWDEGDIRNLSRMVDRVHDFGSLAGVELFDGGPLSGCADTRHYGKAVSQIPFPSTVNPLASGRELTKREIRQLRREHVDGFKRARAAGFDLLTLYCTNASFSLFFLYPFFNKRTDEYGGSFENRIRFTVEVLSDIREAIDDCAIGMRFSIDTMDDYGDEGVHAPDEGKDFVAAIDHLVDYWDINLGMMDWAFDAGSSRFFDTNHQAEYSKWAKAVSSKPVVNVGRFTDPDVMVAAIASGQCDIIGAARPSIADPFLPRKIEEGRYDDIRECIGCNVCVSRWEAAVGTIWCTQNATSGEEYRRGWHPERFTRAANADNDVLVIGAGPAGMECARVLGERGMRRVHLVDAGPDMGGHLRWVTTMPGFGTWGRVTNYRKIQIGKLKNVEHIPGTRLDAGDVLTYGAEYVVVATGSHFDARGVNPPSHGPIEGWDRPGVRILTPEHIVIEGADAGERVMVFDSEGYYMGSALAEMLALQGKHVTYVCDADTFAPYLRYTLEERHQYHRLVELGVEVISQHVVTHLTPEAAGVEHLWSGKAREIACDSLVAVTERRSDCEIYDELVEQPAELEQAGIKGLFLIGDAYTPGMIAQSVFSGHRLAREIDSPDPAVPLPFIRERRLFDSTEEDFVLGSRSLSRTVPEPERASP